MAALNFSSEFADAVEARVKTQTIRVTRRAKVGDRLQLYTGQRTSACRKLCAEDPVCVRVDYVAIRRGSLIVGNDALGPAERDAFAKRDGFADYAAMHAWFSTRHGKETFIGWLHVWYWPGAQPAVPVVPEDIGTPDIIGGVGHAAVVAAFRNVDVALPLRLSGADVGVILDAEGVDVVTIDVNRDRSDDQATAIATMIVAAVNRIAGCPLPGSALISKGQADE